MALSMEYTSNHGPAEYRVTVQDTQDEVELTFTGTTDTNEVIAHGTLRLPTPDTAAAAKLLHQALTALAALHGKRPRGPARHSHAPWTSELDTVLRSTWLNHPPTVPATTAIRDLARSNQRTAAAIRARLARIGCDPDVPGRLLTEATAAMVGRGAAAAEQAED